jgi:hypothetical protein
MPAGGARGSFVPVAWVSAAEAALGVDHLPGDPAAVWGDHPADDLGDVRRLAPPRPPAIGPPNVPSEALSTATVQQDVPDTHTPRTRCSRPKMSEDVRRRIRPTRGSRRAPKESAPVIEHAQTRTDGLPRHPGENRRSAHGDRHPGRAGDRRPSPSRADTEAMTSRPARGHIRARVHGARFAAGRLWTSRRHLGTSRDECLEMRTFSAVRGRCRSGTPRQPGGRRRLAAHSAGSAWSSGRPRGPSTPGPGGCRPSR